MQMGDEMQVREAVEITKPGLQICPNLHPRPDISGCHGLQRHAFESRERRAHDPHGAIGDRHLRILGLHPAERTQARAANAPVAAALA